MPFVDLNINSESKNGDPSAVLTFLHELGYTCAALSVSVLAKLPAQLPQVKKPAAVPEDLKLLTRMNLTISDTSQNHRISQLVSAYDILAVRPTNEKAFQLCCSSLDCDIISVDFSARVSYPIKFKTVAGALQRGVRFEICYASGITGSNDARRNLINNAASLIRATRGRGIIVSSEAWNALGVRAPHDVINLATIWGLSPERAKEAVCEEAALVVKLAGLKRSSFRGVIDIVEDGSKETTINEETSSVVEGNTDTAPTISDAVQSQPLKLVTVVPDKSGKPEKSDSAKRKASQASLNAPESGEQMSKENKPVSKREQKRQAKKARLDRALNENQRAPEAAKKEVGSKPNGFSIQHEMLLAKQKG